MKQMDNEELVSLACSPDFWRTELIPVSPEQTQAVAVYRVSTKKQMENESISRQKDEVRRYCGQKGYSLFKEFEFAETGYASERRKSFNEFIDFCIRNRDKVKVIVIHRIDRFSRSGADVYLALKSVLAKDGIRIESATEPIDDSPMGEFMEVNYAAIARLENRMRMDRTHSSEARLTQKGFWCRSAPTGFENRKVTMFDEEMGRTVKRPMLVPTEDRNQWELLQWGLRQQLSGHYTVAEVARQLAAKGFKSRTRRIIAPQTWVKICRSPIYGGYICEKWTNGELIRAKFDGPITPDEWRELQQVLDGRKQNPVKLPRKKLRDEFPLRQFLRCPVCGNSVTGGPSRSKTGRLYYYYGCANRSCKFGVRAEKANDMFQLLLKELKPSKESLEMFKIAVTEKWKEKYKRLATETTETQKKLIALRERKAGLLRAIEQSSDTPELVVDLKEQYTEVSKEITLTMMERGEKEVEEYSVETVLNRCTYFMENADKLWAKASVEEKFLMQKLIFPNGIRFDDLSNNQTPEISVVYAALRDLRWPEDPMAARKFRVTNTTIEAMIDWYAVLKNLPSFEETVKQSHNTLATV